MSCLYCGYSWCSGNCLLGAQAQPNYVQIQGHAQGQGGISIYQQNPYPVFTMAQTLTAPITFDTSLTNFLEIIADKTDVDACIAFIEQQKQVKIRQEQEMERLQKSFQDDLEKSEKEFLAKCQKYRPSISTDALTRVKGLKAFF